MLSTVWTRCTYGEDAERVPCALPVGLSTVSIEMGPDSLPEPTESARCRAPKGLEGGGGWYSPSPALVGGGKRMRACAPGVTLSSFNLALWANTVAAC
jgi:hypothetical protein